MAAFRAASSRAAAISFSRFNRGPETPIIVRAAGRGAVIRKLPERADDPAPVEGVPVQEEKSSALRKRSAADVAANFPATELPGD